VASAVKVPALFALTAGVTFPSLYVFNCLLGGRLGPADLLRLVASAVGVLVAVLAALGPVVGFFSVTTASYDFVLLLNVAVFAASAGFGGGRLWRMLSAGGVPEVDEGGPTGLADRPATARAGGVDDAGRRVFVAWMLLFALVGTQSGWVLRPFVSKPTEPFAWFTPRSGSVFDAVWASARAVAGL
jgi:hypothetical protein